MKVTSVTVGIPVSNVEQARRWYERILHKAQPDLEPAPGVVEYQIGDTGTWLQLFGVEGEPDKPKRSGWVFRIGVPDVQAERSRLLRLGIETGEVEDYGVALLCGFKDPDGNQLCVYTVT